MIYVIGGANIDIFAKSRRELILRDSNPADFTVSFGGVGHNIAVNLAKLGNRVEFISIFSRDHFGEMMISDCRKQGLQLNYCRRSDLPSSMYLAIMDEDNDMYLGLSDMQIIESLRKEDLNKLEAVLNDDDYLVIDTNLDQDTMLYIADNFKGIKAADAISANKVFKLNGLIDKIDIIKLNHLEAETLVGFPLSSKADVISSLRKLAQKGAREILLTDKKGAYLLKDDQIFRFEHNSTEKNLRNATGAGDAMLAAYLNMHQKGAEVDKMLSYALTAAILTVRSRNTVADIDHQTIEDELSKLNISYCQIN